MPNPSSVETIPQQNPPKRSGARTFFGWLFIVITVLAVLGNLANLATGNASVSSGSAEMLGGLLGTALSIGLPLLIGVLLLRRPRA